MKFKLPIPLFSPDGTTGGYGLTPEQLDGFSLEEEVTEPTDLSSDGDEEILDSESQTSTELDGENNVPSLFDIDGEQVDLDTIKQWKQGNMMQSDYTRKTQELSEQRKQFEQQFAPYKQLDELFASNPQLEQQFTQMIQGHFAQSQPNPTNQNPQVPDISNHPMVQQMQQQLQQQQQVFQQWQEQQRMEQVQSEWNKLMSAYPDAKEQEQELFQYAIDNKMNLEAAYRNLNFDKVRSMTEKQMVENNMKKKVSQTVKPNNHSSAKNQQPSAPNGNLKDVFAWLKTQDLNLTE